MRGKLIETVFSLTVLLATAGVVAAIFAYDGLLRHRQGTAIELQARGVSTWSPRQITVKKGERVRIRIRNVDNVTHGFAIPELDIPEKIIRAGTVETVEFTPRFSGEFTYKCIVQCSRDKHDYMTGRLIVVE